MSDFAQRGLISTLQKLTPASDAGFPEELLGLTRRTPVYVVIPCHGADLHHEALGRILTSLADAAFTEQILLVANGVSGEELRKARQSWGSRVRVLQTDSTLANALRAKTGPVTLQPGKALNLWAAIGWIRRREPEAVVAYQDADVRSFQPEQLARLVFSVVHPEMGYQYAKLYYSRVAERMYGRLTRLFFFPFLQALTRTLGHLPLLDFLAGFRYPLAGECAIPLRLASTMPLHANWGLEAGMLCEVFRRTEPREVCQVDAGAFYDHKHQAVGDARTGLGRMASDIAVSIFSELRREGVEITEALRQSVVRSFYKEGTEAVRRYRNLAMINGLAYEGTLETSTMEVFAAALAGCGLNEAPQLPAWASMDCDTAAFANDFLAATELEP